MDDCREHILRLALPRSNVGFTFLDSMRHDVLLSLKRVSQLAAAALSAPIATFQNL